MSQSIESTVWSLADLFSGYDSPEMQAAFSDLEAQVSAFGALRPNLAAEMPVEAFWRWCANRAINHLESRIHAYAGLSLRPIPRIRTSRLSWPVITLVNIENRTLFFSLWWKELELAQAERLMSQSGDYRYWLETIRHFKPLYAQRG
jgi:oligoendopeptidase F